MGFLKESYSNSQAGLVVSFSQEENSKNFFIGENVTEAMNYFNLYLKDGILYEHTEENVALNTMGITTQEAEAARLALDTVLNNIPDEEVETVKVLFPAWKVGMNYVIGDRVRFEDNIYKVLQNHISQDDWTPKSAPSLFAALLVVPNEEGEQETVSEWVQPDSTNAYMLGDKVIFNEEIYESLIDNNIWSPADYPSGWNKIN